MAQFDLALPKFSAGDLDDEKQRRRIMNYLAKLDEQLRFVLNNLDAENFTETFQETITAGGGSGSLESVKKLESELGRLSTQITQTANRIATKASAEELNELGDVVVSLETVIAQTVEAIEATATALYELDGRVEKAESSIKVAADGISAEVKRATEAETELASRFEQTAEGILIEVGKKANAGDPAPAVDTGEDGGVQVKITADTFDANVPGEDGDFRLNQTGGWLPVLIANTVTADNLTYRYTGPTTIYVNPDATSAQLAGGAYFRSLKDACASLNNRTLTKSVAIHVQGDSYGDVVLNDICGGSITIQGGGHSLIGTMEMSDCTTRIYINGLSVTQPASSAAARAMWIINCRYVAMEASVRISGNGGTHALVVEAGAAVWLYNVELYNATNLLYALYNTQVTALNLKGGNCTNFAWANGCILKMAGSRPDGALRTSNAPLLVPTDPTSLPIDSGSAQPSVPTVQTASWNYTESDSYADGWRWIADDDVRQGYNGKRIYGVIWFDAAAIRNALNGRTINQASLRLYMMGGVGRGVSVKIQMYGTNKEYEGRSGAPALTKSYGTIGSAAPGEINEIAIPVQAVADIVSGATRALVLYSDDTALYKDRGYSANYARFSGSTSADADTCPRLTVTYQ